MMKNWYYVININSRHALTSDGLSAHTPEKIHWFQTEAGALKFMETFANRRELAVAKIRLEARNEM